jgi:hypothetical protein
MVRGVSYEVKEDVNASDVDLICRIDRLCPVPELCHVRTSADDSDLDLPEDVLVLDETDLIGVRIQRSGFGRRVSGFGFQVSGFGFRVLGFGFRVSGFGFSTGPTW